MYESTSAASEIITIPDAYNSWQRENSPSKRLNLKQQDAGDGTELGLMEKLRLSYHGRYKDPRATALSDRAGTIFFWYIAFSELYTMTTYTIPYVLSDWSDTARYYAKVACWFAFIQATANWACVRCVTTSYRVKNNWPNSESDFQNQ